MWTRELMRVAGKDRANSFGLRVRADAGDEEANGNWFNCWRPKASLMS